MQAILSLRANGLDIGCVLIGEEDANYRRQLEAISGTDPTQSGIFFLGRLKRPDSLMKCMDLLVLPSKSEGLPVTVLEAYRDHVPVLLSDIPEHREVSNDGKLAGLFGDQISDLAEAMKNNLLKLSDKTALAFDAFNESFRLDNFLANYSLLIERLVVRKNSTARK